jgi:hypothetical protein
MPFDPANVRILPPVLREPGREARLPPVAPPREPERREPPRRLHIEIVVRLPGIAPPPQRPPRRWRSPSSLWWWAMAFVLGVLIAHAL